MDKTFTVYVVYYEARRLEDGEKSFAQQILMFYDHQQALDKAYYFAHDEVESFHYDTQIEYNNNGRYDFEGDNKHTWTSINVKKHIFCGSKSGPCFEHQSFSY